MHKPSHLWRKAAPKWVDWRHFVRPIRKLAVIVTDDRTNINGQTEINQLTLHKKMTNNSEAEIEQLFENLKSAWNKGDGELYASYFTDDCDYVAFDGQHLKGKIENAQLHNKLFKGFLKGSKLTGKIKSVKFITPEIVIFYVVGAVQLSFQKSEPKSRLSINTNVVIKENGVWKISSFQNTRIKGLNFFQKLFRK